MLSHSHSVCIRKGMFTLKDKLLALIIRLSSIPILTCSHVPYAQCKDTSFIHSHSVCISKVHSHQISKRLSPNNFMLGLYSYLAYADWGQNIIHMLNVNALVGQELDSYVHTRRANC